MNKRNETVSATSDSQQWIEISCDVPSEMADDVADFLIDVTGSGVSIDNEEVDTFSLDDVSEPENKTIKAYVTSEVDLQGLCEQINSYLQQASARFPAYTYQPCLHNALAIDDWSTRWKENFKPTRISDHIIIKPSWEPYSPAASDIIIEIDPGMAFGTGTHPTTKLCLQCIEKMGLKISPYASACFKSVLDVGTGSGILAIAAAKMGASEVIAIDIDPEAVVACERNFDLNGVEKSIKASTTPLEQVEGEFDVVVANILAEDLARMATELIKRIKNGGCIVLSGILIEREPVVMNAFSPFLELIEIAHDGEWSLISFRRTA